MTTPTDTEVQGTSTRPYLIRALHDWCTDNGFTPYLAVYVDQSVQVPREYVKNNEIVLNVSFDATSQLQLGNEFVEFKARFGGTAREIVVPVDHVIAIYARENGQGMAFPVPTPLSAVDGAATDGASVVPAALAPERKGAARLSSVPDAAASVVEQDHGPDTQPSSQGDDDGAPPPSPPAGGNRPSLRRVK
jgi:stringent starvation protein B